MLFQGILFGQNIRFSAGYTEYGLSDQRTEFEQLVSNFNNTYPDIGVPIQKEFPVNTLFCYSVAFTSNEYLEYGANLYVGQTSAFALYGDKLGKVDFKAKFSTWLIGMYIEKYITRNPYLNVALGGSVGIGSGEMNYEASINYPAYPQYNTSDKKGYTNTVLAGEPYLLLSRTIYGDLSICAHLGYRIGGSLSANGTDPNIPLQYQVQQPKDPSANVSGFVTMLGITYALKINPVQ